MDSEKASVTPVTGLLRRWQGGDEEALDELMPMVYDRLLAIARAQMRGERRNHTLEPTAVVHEAYARMVDLELPWKSRVHFFSMAARAMRRVLVDHARAQRAAKRGRGAIRVSLHEHHAIAQPVVELLELEEALERLQQQDLRASRVVECHYFGGMSYREIAGALEVSEATVDRDLRFARAWLRRELENGSRAG